MDNGQRIISAEGAEHEEYCPCESVLSVAIHEDDVDLPLEGLGLARQRGENGEVFAGDLGVGDEEVDGTALEIRGRVVTTVEGVELPAAEGSDDGGTADMGEKGLEDLRAQGAEVLQL